MSSWSLSGWGALFSTAIVSVSTFFGNCAKAQITPDGTLPTNSSIENDGNTFNITGGTQSGGNLFHSFGEFSVPTDNTAFFNNSADIQNIISRVTGNSPSIIDGLIRANGTANLFLINPNGIIFGQNAQLNIGGSFLASTASAVKFANNLEFSATNPQSAPLLTINVPIGLQYGANPGFILNQSQRFEVKPEKSLALVGGDVTVEGGILFAPSGRIELGGVQEPGTVDLSWNGNILSLNFPDNLARADVFLNGAQLDVTGDNGGSIAVNARNIDIWGASALYAGILFGQSSADSKAKDISLNATGAINIDQQSIIQNFIISDAMTNGGDIRITTSELFVTNGGRLIASSLGEGDAGNLIIDAKQRILFDGTNSGAGSIGEESGKGNSGDIYLSTQELTLSNGAQLAASSLGEGDAGNLFIDAKQRILFDGTYSAALSTVEHPGKGNSGDIYLSTQELTLSNGALLAASNLGEGDAGNLFIDAKQRILFDANSAALSTVEHTGKGNSGDIYLSTQELTLSNGAQLAASSLGEGDAGNLFIDAKQRILFDANSAALSTVEHTGKGNSGDIYLSTQELTLSNGGQVIASTSGQGDAGNLFIDAKQRILFDGTNSAALSTVEQSGIGKGGDIYLSTQELTLSNGGQVIASTRGIGKGGDIYLSTQELTLSNRGQVLASTHGQGDAGNLFIDAKQRILFDTNSAAASTVEQSGIGKGGDIYLSTQELTLSNGAQLTASTRGEGDAGNLFIDAKQRILFDTNSAALSNVEQSGIGKGGDIYLSTQELTLSNGAQLAVSSLGEGDAGNLIIDAKQRILFDGTNSAALSTVEYTCKGNSGDIYLSTQELTLSNGGQVIASTRGQGDAGNLFIDAKQRILFDGTNSGAASTVEQSGIGKGGDIYISTEELTVSNGAYLAGSTLGEGDAGNLFIDAKQRILFDTNSSAASTVEQSGIGKGGDIYISTEELTVSNGAQLGGSTFGEGDAGNLFIDAKQRILFDGTNSAAASTVEQSGIGKGGDIYLSTQELTLSNGGQVIASTRGQGDAGNLFIDAKQRILFDGTNSAAASTVEQSGIGKGGDIYLSTQELTLSNGGQVIASTRGQGDAGNLFIDAKQRILFDTNSGAASTVEESGIGNGRDIRITTREFSVINGAQVTASTFGQGDAGNIEINASSFINISGTASTSPDSSGLLTSTSSNSIGKGGDITLNTDIFRLLDGAVLDARTRNDGNGGNITVSANQVEVLNGGQLISTTFGNGRAGKISVNANDQMIVSGTDNTFNNRVARFPSEVLNISSTSGLFVRSESSGLAGDIEVTSSQLTLANQGRFIAESASGDGGNINLQVNDFLLLRGNALISTNAGTQEKGGNGGNININSKFIVAVPKENSDITANAFTGKGGNVQINTQGIFGIEPRPTLTDASDITASSLFGVNGTIEINTPDIDPNSGLLELPAIAVDPQIAQGCYTPSYAQSKFVVIGRGGLPLNPREAFSNETPQAEWATLNESSDNRFRQTATTNSPIPTSATIVEATGWVTNAKGEIILTANPPTTTAHSYGRVATTCGLPISAQER